MREHMLLGEELDLYGEPTGSGHLSSLKSINSDIAQLGWSFGLDRASDDGAVSRLWAPPVQDISEPSDVIPADTSTPYSITLGGSQTGVINFAGDHDWFSVTLVAGQSYVFTMQGSGGSPITDTYLELHNSNGALLAIDDDGGTGPVGVDFSSLLRFTATQSGTYYIVARPWEPDSGPISDPDLLGGYTITFNTGAPQNPLDTINLGPTQTGPNIAVYFATSGQTWNGDLAARNWTQGEMDAAMAALATYSAVSNLTFSITTNSAAAQFILTLDTDIGTNVLGHMGTSGGVGYGAFNPNGFGWTTNGLLPGGAGFVTLVHEFGHGLGLAHPHDNGGVSEVMQGVTNAFGSYGTFNLNQGVFTTMSYNDGWDLNPVGGNVSSTSGSQSTPGPLDIALIQQRYGANTATNLGNTTYSLVAFTTQYRAIWDAGGIDTINFGGVENTVIDLRAATLLNEVGGGGFISYVQGFHMGFTIANGVVIENATGGLGNDNITGNSANNTLIGNAGADTFSAGAGNDIINGGTGVDTIDGGTGFDTAIYNATSTGASWARNVNGTWTVVSGTDGTETVTSIEMLQFNDRNVHLDTAERTFSGDGTSDILLRRVSDGVTAIWNLTGTTVSSSAPTLWQAGNEWTIRAGGDFDGDGRDDFFLRRTDGVTAIWFMNGTNVTSADVTLWQAGNEWQFVGIGDFNADGRDDFLLRRVSDGVTSIWNMNGTNVQSADVTNWQAGLEWTLLNVGDFNGDGRDDFLWRRASDGVLAIWEMNNTTVSHADVTSQQAGVDWTVVGVGDFNGDGRDDLLLFNDTLDVASVWLMNGETVLQAGAGLQAANGWTFLAVGDYNGDGRDDLLLRRDADGVTAIWFMNGTVVQGTDVTTAQAGTEWFMI